MKSRRWVASAGAFLVTVLSGFSSPTVADDTEIYFGSAGVADGVVKPNVLFILDTSGSMSATVPGTGKDRLDNMKDALYQIIDNSHNINVGLMRFSDYGGPVLFPITDIDAAASTVRGEPADENPSFEIPIADVNDDAEEVFAGDVKLNEHSLEFTKEYNDFNGRIASASDDKEQYNTGSIYDGSTDLDLGHNSYGDNSNILVALRFTNVDVPKKAVIHSANIEFVVRQNGAGDLDLMIDAQDVTNAPALGSSGQYISNLSPTTAPVDWDDVPNSPTGEVLTTPDLKSIVQELVDAGPWSDGNAMAFRVYLNPSSGTPGDRQAHSYESDPALAPVLKIKWSDNGAIKNQIVGLRFQTVDIPQGATVTSAQLKFTAQSSDTEATDLVIAAEASDNSAAFEATSNNISGRSLGAAQINWSVDSWAANNSHLSPDITALVQEVVDRSGWCGGNAMSFVVSGTGLRQAVSADGSLTGAPQLLVEYQVGSIPVGGGCINQSVSTQIAHSYDDVEEDLSDGDMSRTSSDLDMVYDPSYSNSWKIGLRFRSLPIPKGAVVTKADILFTARSSDSGTTNLTIHGESSGDAASFSSSDYDVSNRTLTSQSAAWSPGAWSTEGQYATPDLKDVVQEIVSHADWSSGNDIAFVLSGSGTRRAYTYNGDASKGAILRVTIQGSLGNGTAGDIKTVRTRLKEIVQDLPHSGVTPVVDTLYESALYYRGEDILYGKVRGSGSSGYRISHPGAYSGGDTAGYPPYAVYRASGCTDENLGASACASEEIKGTPAYTSPMSLGCQQSYTVLLTDGQANSNHSETLVKSMAGPTCMTNYDASEAISGSTSVGSGERCGIELAEYMYEHDQNSDIAGDQTVITHTIGFNLGDTSNTSNLKAVRFLKHVAAAGGGQFYEADSASELADVFQTIIASVLNKPTSFAAPSLTVNAFNKLFHRDEVYFSFFQPTSDKRWNGNIKKFGLCEGKDTDSCELGEIMDSQTPPIVAIGSDQKIKDTSVSYWTATGADGREITKGGAGSRIPSHALREVYTYTGAGAPSDIGLDDPDHEVADDNTALEALLNNGSMTAGQVDDLINWIRGQDVLDEDEDGNTNENRWIHGDPLHSNPLPITYGGTDDNPVIKLFSATNEGGIRMINADSGVEEWFFIPQELLGIQNELMTNSTGDHIYGLDGELSAYVNDENGDGKINPVDGDFVWLYFGMRRGGQNIYALDVTPASAMTATTDTLSPKLMWRIEGGSAGFNQLGQTWSRPMVTRVSFKSGSNLEHKPVLVFAGGYDTALDASFGTSTVGNAIYIVDPETGALLWSAGPTGSGADLILSDMNYAIPSNVALLDSNGDGATDRLYVGDLGGQVWRIDIESLGSSANYSGARLAVIGDPTTAEDQRKFFYPPDVVQVDDSIYSGIGAEYDMVVMVSGDRPSPLETTVHNRVYAFRDYLVDEQLEEKTYSNSGTPVYTYPITHTATIGGVPVLYDATSNLIQVGSDTQKTAALESLKTSSGWYFDFKETTTPYYVGEKGLSSPIVLDNKIFFTTFLPQANPDNPCQGAEGTGRLYAVNVFNAAAVYKNWSGSDPEAYETRDRIHGLGGGIPSGAVPIFQQNGVTLMVGGGGGATSINPNIALPRIKTYWYQE